MKWAFIVLILLSSQCLAQYPFEIFSTPKVSKAPFKVMRNERDSSAIATAIYKKYKLELRGNWYSDSTDVLIYHAGKIFQRLKVAGIDFIGVDEPLLIGDINGDGAVDFKIVIYNNGSGLAGSLERKIYLFSDTNNHFQYVSFMDFFGYKERDFDSDGRFEIIGCSLLRKNGHSYWLFDLYHYKDGGLINVSKQYNYPIAIPYLYEDTYKPTTRFTKSQLRQFSLQAPLDYVH